MHSGSSGLMSYGGLCLFDVGGYFIARQCGAASQVGRSGGSWGGIIRMTHAWFTNQS